MDILVASMAQKRNVQTENPAPENAGKLRRRRRAAVETIENLSV